MYNNQIFIYEARRLSELETYKDRWDELLKLCPKSTPTQTYAWLHAFFSYKVPVDKEWICLFAFNNLGDLMGVYPLIILKSKGLPGIRFQFFTIPYDTNHTVRVDALVKPGHEMIIENFLLYLKNAFKAYPIIRINRIPEFSSTMRYLRLKNRQFTSLIHLTSAESFLNIENNYEAFFRGLSSNVRKNIKRSKKKLTKITNHSFRIKFNDISNSEILQNFMELENSGWKSKDGYSIKDHLGDADLFLSATNLFMQKGWMQWNFLIVNQEIISGLLSVKINVTLYLLKIAYNENYSYCSPGNLLINKIIEDSYTGTEISEINFMNEREWFKMWNVKERKLFDIIIIPRNFILTPLIKTLRKFIYYKNKLKRYFKTRLNKACVILKKMKPNT